MSQDDLFNSVRGLTCGWDWNLFDDRSTGGSSSAQPATNIAAHSKALVCQDADLRGDITIGEGSVIHPKCSILAMGGPIVIGKECLVEETAVIVNRYVCVLCCWVC